MPKLDMDSVCECCRSGIPIPEDVYDRLKVRDVEALIAILGADAEKIRIENSIILPDEHISYELINGTLPQDCFGLRDDFLAVIYENQPEDIVMSKLLPSAKYHVVAYCEDAEHPLGYLSFSKVGSTAQISEIYIEPEFQHHHIGAGMFEFIKSNVKLQLGITDIMLEGVEEAADFYTKIGFVPVDVAHTGKVYARNL